MKRIKTFIYAPVFKIASLNAGGVGLKILTGVLTSKVLALFVGPAGLGLVGNMRNFFNAAESLSTLGFQNGIIKYVAEAEGDRDRLHKVISTSFTIFLFGGLLLSAVLFLAAENLNQMVFEGNYAYSSVFKAAAVALPWFSISILLTSILNGLGRYRKVVYINMIGNLLTFALSVVLIWQLEIEGALLAIVVAPSILFFVSFYFIYRDIGKVLPPLKIAIDRRMARNLSGYTLMALVSGVGGPWVMLAIRSEIIKVSGIDAAGFWEALNRISGFYFMFLTTVLTVYFLPKLSLASGHRQSRKVMSEYFVTVLPLFGILLLTLYFLRGEVIRIILSKEFLPVSAVIGWQLAGDFVKGAALILGYQFFAKKMIRMFIISEIASLSVIWFSSIYLLDLFGLEGIVIAHFISYILYFLLLIVINRKNLFIW